MWHSPALPHLLLLDPTTGEERREPDRQQSRGWGASTSHMTVDHRASLSLMEGKGKQLWLGYKIEVLTWTRLYFSIPEIRLFLSVKVTWQLRDFSQAVIKGQGRESWHIKEGSSKQKRMLFPLCIQLIQSRKQLLVELSVYKPQSH